MCCLFTIVVFLGPRLGIFFWYLFDTARWNLAFSDFPLTPLLLTCLGFFLLPWTTLMYVVVFTGGLTFIDWVLLVLALLVDLSSYGGGAWGNRDRVPGYSR